MHKTAYKSSIYYNSKSKNNNIYSRYEKIIDIMVAENFTNPKLVDVEKEIVPFINEKNKNIVRYEVQIKRRIIRYNFRVYGIIPDLFNYWNQVDAFDYLKENLKPILFCGDYYNSYHSYKRLLTIYTEKVAKNLIEFQNYISMYGLDNAKKSYKSYYRYLSFLEKAEINPLLIPKNDGITFIENPVYFLKENSEKSNYIKIKENLNA
jgi:hypothetical protein